MFLVASHNIWYYINPCTFTKYQKETKYITIIYRLCSKKLKYPITLTVYSLLPKSTSSAYTKSQLQRKMQHFFLARVRTKTYHSEFTKTLFHVKNSIFFLVKDLAFLGGERYPLPTPACHPWPSLLDLPLRNPPEFQPDLYHWQLSFLSSYETCRH